VKHRASPRFWRAYRGLPQDVRRLADRSYKLLKDNPAHPSLHFKKVGQFWSARIGLHHRALAVEADTDLVWFWIGSHDGYDKLLDKKPANMRLQPTAARRHRKSRKGGRRG
jgi:hypothetical protein